MNEIELRKQAVKRCISGEKPAQVASDLKRSKQWVYKWLKRFKTGEKNWFLSQSKAPKTLRTKLSNETEQEILRIRKALAETKYSQIGAISIQYEFGRIGAEPPAVWTINRVLKRHGLTQKSKRQTFKNVAYPKLFLSCQQMDLVGPRYLKGGVRFYVFNIIDTQTHRAGVYPIPDKSADSILNGLISFWQEYGMPDSIQMDNELSFRGSNRHPRSLGKILRFILLQSIVPVFIPLSEPWRNGIVEKFNDCFNSKFFRIQTFKNFEHLQKESSEFVRFHNQYHRYSSQNNKTPNEMLKELSEPVKLPVEQNVVNLPLEGGTILFVRYVRSDLTVKVLNSEFIVKKELVYSYVVAELIIENHCLLIKQDNTVHHKFTFVMPVDW